MITKNQNNNENIVEKVKGIIEKLCWVPLLTGLIGYCYMGNMSFVEGLYATIALYFVNPVSDLNNVMVIITKFLAVIVTATIIISLARDAWYRIQNFIVKFYKDSTAIYGDDYYSKKFAENYKHGYLCEDLHAKRIEKTKDHVVMFSDDLENIKFISDHMEEFKSSKSRVFMRLNKLDPFMFDELDDDMNLHFFNFYDILARDYWEKHSLIEACLNASDEEKIKVGILGYGNIGRAIFRNGYLNNLYSITQNIEYHIWGCSKQESAFLQKLNTGNKDIIVVHDSDYLDCSDEIAGMTRVILTEEKNSIELIRQLFSYISYPQIHCYSEKKISFDQIFKSKDIPVVFFGNMEGILSAETIKTEKEYRLGKLFNYNYNCVDKAKKEGIKIEKLEDYNHINEESVESQWKELSVFIKGSNIAYANHYWIKKYLRSMATPTPEKVIAELEHIRWCRYHYFHGWEYGKERDNEKRIHPLLVDFSMLDYDDKQKDEISLKSVKEEVDLVY
ncbi:MAG: RyR domain-containing protein [Lachnospiraceae bacterium]|nr:RyR domain-containing protein [Lachnospiraceae bacterium]